jgi:hypothetical protein
VCKEWSVWRLQPQKPRVVVMTLDTMVMDNDEASKRQGCDPTDKKGCGRRLVSISPTPSAKSTRLRAPSQWSKPKVGHPPRAGHFSESATF